jgi:hypothetical protein
VTGAATATTSTTTTTTTTTTPTNILTAAAADDDDVVVVVTASSSSSSSVAPSSPTKPDAIAAAIDISPNWTKQYADTTRLKTNASKYIVGEAYSGKGKCHGKLKQLEQRLANLRNRFIHRHHPGNDDVDVTEAVAGAALVLAQIRDDTRVDNIISIVRNDLAAFPLLNRMADAGRFVIVVVPYANVRSLLVRMRAST